jgi:hypothetical protein
MTSFGMLALMGLIETLTGFSPLYYLPGARGTNYAPIYRLGVQRAQGLLPNSTALSVTMAVTIFLSLLLLSKRRVRRRRMAAWLTLFVAALAMMGSMARTGWAIAAMGAAFWFFLARTQRARLVVFLVVLLLVAAMSGLGYSALAAVGARAFDLSRQDDVSTLYARLQWPGLVWSHLRTDTTARLLFGFGPGTAPTLSAAWGGRTLRALFTTNYVIRFAEGGLAGLFALCGLLAFATVGSWQLSRNADREGALIGVFLLIAFLQFAVGSLTLPLFEWLQTKSIFWTLLATLLAAQEQWGRARPNRRLDGPGPSETAKRVQACHGRRTRSMRRALVHHATALGTYPKLADVSFKRAHMRGSDAWSHHDLSITCMGVS